MSDEPIMGEHDLACLECQKRYREIGRALRTAQQTEARWRLRQADVHELVLARGAVDVALDALDDHLGRLKVRR